MPGIDEQGMVLMVKKNLDPTSLDELINILKDMPSDVPVLVNGYKSDYENF